MNIRITGRNTDPCNQQPGGKMDTIFYTLHDFMLHTKNIVYLLMGGILIALPLFWRFLTGRDEKKRTY